MSQLWAMFAIQGPGSVELLEPLIDADLASMKYPAATGPNFAPGLPARGGIISRTGYTGRTGSS